MTACNVKGLACSDEATETYLQTLLFPLGLHFFSLF